MPSGPLETLQTLEPELRLSIIEELSGLGDRPGAEMLLRLLSSAGDFATRTAAIAALERMTVATRERYIARREPLDRQREGEALSEPATALGSHGGSPSQDVSNRPSQGIVRPAPAPSGDVDRETGGQPDRGDERFLLIAAAASRSAPRLARCLVTPVDGKGRGSIVVSVSQKNERRTAAFLCDVQRGIRDVVGDVEPESPQAGGLIDAMDHQPESESARDVPELALGLLAGSLMLCGPAVPPAVRDWLVETLGAGFQPAAFPAAIPGLDIAALDQAEIPDRAATVLDACPSWLDSSPLTFELAEEISLREGRPTADPERDAGAYRYLFEHRLIHCLELYQRMLLWMAWLWKFRNEVELSRSALALACQLSDEQFAVPSHPFTVELTTRSFKAAQRQLRQAGEPRTDGGA